MSVMVCTVKDDATQHYMYFDGADLTTDPSNTVPREMQDALAKYPHTRALPLSRQTPTLSRRLVDTLHGSK